MRCEVHVLLSPLPLTDGRDHWQEGVTIDLVSIVLANPHVFFGLVAGLIDIKQQLLWAFL
jgi:hypothetical protein